MYYFAIWPTIVFHAGLPFEKSIFGLPERRINAVS